MARDFPVGRFEQAQEVVIQEMNSFNSKSPSEKKVSVMSAKMASNRAKFFAKKTKNKEMKKDLRKTQKLYKSYHTEYKKKL